MSSCPWAHDRWGQTCLSFLLGRHGPEQCAKMTAGMTEGQLSAGMPLRPSQVRYHTYIRPIRVPFCSIMAMRHACGSLVLVFGLERSLRGDESDDHYMISFMAWKTSGVLSYQRTGTGRYIDLQTTYTVGLFVYVVFTHLSVHVCTCYFSTKVQQCDTK